MKPLCYGVTLFLLLAVLLASAATGVLTGCASGRAPIAAPSLRIASPRWIPGSAVELTLHTTPPHVATPITLTVLAPGEGRPQIAGLSPDFFGLAGVQLLWLPPENRETEIALAAVAGARYIGLDFDWRRIEPERGHYNWKETDAAVALAKRYGLRLVPMLLYTPRWASSASFAPLDYHRAPPLHYEDYRDFVHAVVNRYKPYGESQLTADGYGITDWVIWNEPSVSRAGEAPQPGQFWSGSLEEYIRLLRAGYEGAHAADPTCNVLNGGLADVFWAPGKLDVVTALERLYDPDGDGNAADGGRPFFDILNVHIYQTGMPDAAWYRERLEAIARVMARFGDADKPVWVTETGYGSVASHSVVSSYVDEATQAEAVRLVYETCAAFPYVQRVFWWSLRDYYYDGSATNEAMEAHYGLLRANFAPKPSYMAYGFLTGSTGEILVLTATTDAKGTARAVIPPPFVARPGTYVVWATLDGKTQAAVGLYQALPDDGASQE
ncbi:MAG: glycosyl hydrolase [Anaerolineae bacterium]|nr:glycosyl hydrolase [Anaerolineae bacterium]